MTARDKARKFVTDNPDAARLLLAAGARWTHERQDVVGEIYAGAKKLETPRDDDVEAALGMAATTAVRVLLALL